MAQNTHQRRASGKVAALMAQNELSIAWLAKAAEADAGTIGDFLAGKRWPKVGTQGRIEKALGWPAGVIHQIGLGDEVSDLPMSLPTVGGDVEDPSYVESPGERLPEGMTDDEVLRRLQQMQEDVRALSEWVARRSQGGGS